MLNYTWKSHSLFGIYNKYFFEEVFYIRGDFFEFLFFSDCRLQVKIRIAASSVDLSLHIMPFERILCEKHKVKEYTKSPYINRYSIIRITDNLRRHILLCSTMSLCTSSTYWSGESKICNFIANIIRIFIFVYFLQQDVLRFNIPVNKVFLMNAL